MRTIPKEFRVAPAVRAALLLAGFASAAQAAEERAALDEVVVTASKREQRLQDVPASITALGQQQIESLRLDGIEDFQRFTPGLSFSQVGSAQRNGPNLTIRGISNTRLTQGSDTIAALTTAFFIDEMAVTPVDPRLFDVARIEVLKGPQGTLYGAASMGGTVKVILNEPDASSFDARVAGSLSHTQEGDPSMRGDLMVNIPLIQDKLAARFVAYGRDEGGFIDSRFPGTTAERVRGRIENAPGTDESLRRAQRQNLNEDVNALEAYGARLAIKYTPNQQFELMPTVYFQTRDLESDAFIHRNLGEGWVREGFLPDPRREEFFLTTLTAKYRASFAELVSVTGFFERNFNWGQDLTSLVLANFGGTPDGGIAALSSNDFRRGEDSFSQEIRLQSPQDQGRRLEWVLGAYYFSENSFSDTLWFAPGFNAVAATPLPNDEDLIAATDSSGEYENTAFFADVTLHVTDALSVAAGVRYFDQEKSDNRTDYGPIQGVPPGQANVRPPSFVQEDGWTPRFNISYSFSPDYMVYASAAEGFRLGGANNNPVLVTNPACQAALAALGLQGNTEAFFSDTVWNYEIGAKTRWADDRLVFNLTAFQIDWTDLQQSVALTPFNAGCPTAVTGNLGSATVRGFETELVAQPLERLQLTATASLSRARFDTPPTGVTSFVEDGPVPNVPDWAYSATAQYSFPLLERSAFLRAEWTYTDSRKSVGFNPRNPNPFLYMDAYDLLNLRFGIESGDWEGTLFVENLTNKMAALGGGIQAGESFSNQVFVNRPLTVGITVRKQF